MASNKKSPFYKTGDPRPKTWAESNLFRKEKSKRPNSLDASFYNNPTVQSKLQDNVSYNKNYNMDIVKANQLITKGLTGTEKEDNNMSAIGRAYPGSNNFYINKDRIDNNKTVTSLETVRSHERSHLMKDTKADYNLSSSDHMMDIMNDYYEANSDKKRPTGYNNSTDYMYGFGKYKGHGELKAHLNGYRNSLMNYAKENNDEQLMYRVKNLKVTPTDVSDFTRNKKAEFSGVFLDYPAELKTNWLNQVVDNSSSTKNKNTT